MQLALRLLAAPPARASSPTRPLVALAIVAVLAGVVGLDRPASGQYQDLIANLNAHATVAASPDAKSGPAILDAYLDLGDPPMPIGAGFNLYTIHPGMDRWDDVAGWAETNAGLAEAILDARRNNTIVFGLPYGTSNVSARYREAGLYVDVAVDGSLRKIDFAYLDAINEIAAFVAAETYRLLEAGRHDDALDLALAHLLVLRQLIDRDFLEEKLFTVALLKGSLGNLRDVFWTYREDIRYERFVEIAYDDIPFLWPDRRRWFMPEADRKVSERLIDEVFDQASEQADPAAFRDVFGAIQATEKPLTQFGAALRWERIAAVHGSLEASKQRLKLVYDDWYRRWRVRPYDRILQYTTQFDRTNEIRYAAVLYSMENIQTLFTVRDSLIAEINGTAAAAGLCAYVNRFNGAYPRSMSQLYGQSMRQQYDLDPYDPAKGPFKYELLDERTAVDTALGRLWIEPNTGMLWARGADLEDDRGRTHSDDGAEGDMVLWPPIKAMARTQGLID